MNNEKISSNQTQANYSGEELTDIHSSKPDASELEKIKKMYLPESKADNSPSEESIENANGLKHPESIKPSSLV